ncbi:helix-turn-helix domain-containing protein [Dorea formicigenerans]|uniref:helix-turn-helix domain-containing protein n=1 Tax=Dorea formicigenerans TaxID=39486 RepID=UPI003A89D714
MSIFVCKKSFAILKNTTQRTITLADLSKSANISKSECSRCFKLSLNTTPYKYLTEYRLSMAAQLLKTTREPVGNIAASVGFRQMSHFGKCFKEKTGYSPKAYREVENNL